MRCQTPNWRSTSSSVPASSPGNPPPRLLWRRQRRRSKAKRRRRSHKKTLLLSHLGAQRRADAVALLTCSSCRATESDRRSSAAGKRCRSRPRILRLIVASPPSVKCEIAFRITILPCSGHCLRRIGVATAARPARLLAHSAWISTNQHRRVLKRHHEDAPRAADRRQVRLDVRVPRRQRRYKTRQPGGAGRHGLHTAHMFSVILKPRC